jgi:hypothetical protein
MKATLLAALVFLSACSKPTEEQRIHSTFDRTEKAIEAGKVASAVDHVSRDFKSGDIDRDEVKAILMSEVLKGQGAPISVYRRNEQIAVTGSDATASFDALLTRSDTAHLHGLVPSDAQTYHFDLTLKKEDDGEWRVTGATWKTIDPKEFVLP